MTKTIKQVTFEEALKLVRDDVDVFAAFGSDKPATKIFKRLTIEDALTTDYVFYIFEEVKK